MVKAILKEITLQKHYLSPQPLQSIYFGGGTPSLLSEEELSLILETVHHTFKVSQNAEITLEANPDDFQRIDLKKIRQLGINRLSIGIQSFYSPHLVFLNRQHDAAQARQAVKEAQSAGFDNLTIDLIYGIPADNHQIWQEDLLQALALEVSHISAYCLTIEEKTVFGKWVRQQRLIPAEEDFTLTQFKMLTHTLQNAGYEQYEISNFAKNKMYAQHNSNYWAQGEYLGIGPSAHSYSGLSRQFNVANNALYLRAIQKDEIPYTQEILTQKDKVNEYLMTQLRTQWGVNLLEIKQRFGYDLHALHLTLIQKLLKEKMLTENEHRIFLTEKGKFLADEISAQLFI